jgi:hypothetical protein
LELAQRIGFADGQASAYSRLIEAFSATAITPKLWKQRLKRLEFAERSGDSTRIMWGYASIGNVYFYSS